MEIRSETTTRLGLRGKLVVIFVLVLTAATVASVLAVRQILLTQLSDEIERSLEKEVGEFRTVLGSNNPDTGEPFGSDLPAIFDTYLSQNLPSEGEEVLALIDGVPYASERAHDAGFPLEDLTTDLQRWSNLDGPQQGVLATAAGDLRYVVEPIVLNDGVRGTLIISNSSAFEREEIDEVSRTMALVGIGVTILASIVSWFAAGRVVSPLRRLTDTAQSITDTDLHRRIDARGNDEVAVLARTFNQMLDRLEEAFTAQRRFADDAGHELRTPVTIVRGHLELMGDDPAQRADTMNIVMDELGRIDRIVNDLLLLSKADQPGFVEMEAVDLDELTRDLHAKALGIANRGWQLEAVGAGLFLMDRQRITQAMMQLAVNASQHTPEGVAIWMGSSVTAGGIRLWVRDDGPGIPLAAQETIFDRFARGDGHRRSDGAGLGLAIVRAIVEAHGGRADVTSRPGHGAKFTLHLPVRTPGLRPSDRRKPAERTRAGA